MKISVIGAGNVGSFSAMNIAREELGDVVLVDILKGMAHGKALDMDDACSALKCSYSIQGTDDLSMIFSSDIVVITAGLARKPGMTREDLISKNASILNDVCREIKDRAPDAIVIVVTNPLDVMTFYALQLTGFSPSKVFGMGLTLDAARFRNLISKTLKIPNKGIEAVVIGSHGEGMMPISRLTTIKGVPLDEFSDEKTTSLLENLTKDRGKEIVSFLGNGSAFFAPAVAVTELVRAVVRDEKLTFGVSALLNGEYNVTGTCIGVPAVIGRNGIEKIVQLPLTENEQEFFSKIAGTLRGFYPSLPCAKV